MRNYQNEFGHTIGAIKMKAVLPYPVLSMSGTWQIENMMKGLHSTQLMTMERAQKTCYGPERNIMTIRLSESESLELNTADMVWLPVVSGTGYSEWGEYTISGDFDPETGTGNYDLKFTWGQCTLDTTSTTGVGLDMMAKPI